MTLQEANQFPISDYPVHDNKYQYCESMGEDW